MQKITLTPGEWAPVHSISALQVAGQHAVRIALGTWPAGSDTTQANLITPAADAPYFKTQDYDPNIIRLEDFGITSGMAIYLRPHGSEPVDVVVLA